MSKADQLPTANTAAFLIEETLNWPTMDETFIPSSWFSEPLGITPSPGPFIIVEVISTPIRFSVLGYIALLIIMLVKEIPVIRGLAMAIKDESSNKTVADACRHAKCTCACLSRIPTDTSHHCTSE